MEKKIRCLKAEEIEIRVAQILEKGVQLLLYKDSRCDKRILDETFGINGWKNKYKVIYFALYQFGMMIKNNGLINVIVELNLLVKKKKVKQVMHLKEQDLMLV